MNFDPVPFEFWPAFLTWAIVVAIFFVVALVIGALVKFITGGREGVGNFIAQLGDGLGDFLKMSPRRILALTSLTFREAIRRKALLVFVVFGVLFLFANWFLSGSTERADQQVQVYVEFVLRTIEWITLPVMLILACWSLPEDIKARSLHTVITKPARRSEVIIGRMLGLIGISTLIILLMGSVGYVWILRVTPESAQEELVARVPVYGDLLFTNNNGEQRDKGKNVGDVWEFRSFISGDTAESAVWTIDGITPGRIEKSLASVLEDEQQGLIGKVDSSREITLDDVLNKPSDDPDVQEFRLKLEQESSYTWGPDKAALLEKEGGDARVIELETSFEAFRTYKGDIDSGLLCKIELTNRFRTDFARGVRNDNHFAPAFDPIMEGDYNLAAEKLRELADDLRNNKWRAIKLIDASNPQANLQQSSSEPVSSLEWQRIAVGMNKAVTATQFATEYAKKKERSSDWSEPVISALTAIQKGAATAAEKAADSAASVNDDDRKIIADGMTKLADAFEAHSGSLKESLIDVVARLPVFSVREYKRNNIVFSPNLTYHNADSDEELNLYKDIVRGDQLTVEVYCQDAQQLLGMARPDLFIRTADRPFIVGYAKAILGIWLLVTMVIVLSVTASTFVKGPVAFILVASLITIGASGAREFMQEIITGQTKGGGPVESIIRIITHKNPQVPLDPGAGTTIAQTADVGFIAFLKGIRYLIPNLDYVNMRPYVANGFDVDWNAALFPALMVAFGLLIPCILLGHFSLKFREVESK